MPLGKVQLKVITQVRILTCSLDGSVGSVKLNNVIVVAGIVCGKQNIFIDFELILVKGLGGSLIQSVIIRVITKSYDREAGIRFVNHEYDYRPTSDDTGSPLPINHKDPRRTRNKKDF